MTPPEANSETTDRAVPPPHRLRGWLRVGAAAGASVLAGLVLLAAALGVGEALREWDTLPVETVVPLGTGAAQALPERPQGRVIVHLRNSADTLAAYFWKLDYRLPQLRTGTDVPRVYVPALPRDLEDMQPTERRKSLFLRIVLPLVLKENERLHEERGRLLAIRDHIRSGAAVTRAEQAWLAQEYEDYDVARGNLTALLRRVDVIPPSLALAQAATESAWGTSRFVRQGNALFGMWTWSEDVPGIVPSARDDDAHHRVRAFETLQESVSAYMYTLNTHWAYREFRERRAAQRRAGKPLNGLALATAVTRYSEQREVYTVKLRSLIRMNELAALDRTALGDDWVRSAAHRSTELGSPALIAQEPGR
jgi:Bax protein